MKKILLIAAGLMLVGCATVKPAISKKAVLFCESWCGKSANNIEVHCDSESITCRCSKSKKGRVRFGLTL